MNILQKKILIKFIGLNEEFVKYSDIQLRDIDNDKYNYHLQQLVRTGYITKNSSKQYSLTIKGSQYIAQLDTKGYDGEKFRVSVIAIVTRDTSSVVEVLLQERRRNPFIGDIASVSGKVRHGEKIEIAAARNLKIESGLIGEFKLRGVIRKIRLDLDGDLLEDIFFHVCSTNNPTGELIEENTSGKNYWAEYDDLIKASRNNKGDGDEPMKIYQYIKEGKQDLFYIEEISTVEHY
jgi:ADP-ribose pyrophosphatase YjhB (NUDIX family)